MKIKEFDTIASIATSFGDAGISIVRISGENAFDIANRIFTPFNKHKKNIHIKDYQTHTISYGTIKEDENVIDEVLVSVMKAPNTYTKEDIVEINCHGGKICTQKVLSAVLKNGARLSLKGEFTKRAFLNGRIDLSHAEAVLDIINAKTETSHALAINRLSGKLSDKIKQYRNDILKMTAHIEASIDYPEHDDEAITYSFIKKNTENLIKDIQALTDLADTGRIVKEGIDTAIIGRTNVGKSSILNALLKEDRAIVSDINGTTRDVLKEHINIGGVALNIMDTAGIRKTDDEIEKIGVEKSKEYAKYSDLILLVLDNSKPFSKEDKALLDMVLDKKIIIILNKIDLPSALNIDDINNVTKINNIIKVSAKNDIGLENLKDEIADLFFNGDINISQDTLICNERNKQSLYNSVQSLKNVIKTIDDNMPEDFLSMDLLDAYSYLGEITGESLDEDVIDKIFSEFCLGK